MTRVSSIAAMMLTRLEAAGRERQLVAACCRMGDTIIRQETTHTRHWRFSCPVTDVP
jgi:hypothetical protein